MEPRRRAVSYDPAYPRHERDSGSDGQGSCSGSFISDEQRQCVAPPKLPKLAQLYQEEARQRGHRFEDLNEPFADEDWAVAAGLSAPADPRSRLRTQSPPLEKRKRSSPPSVPSEQLHSRQDSVASPKRRRPASPPTHAEEDLPPHHGEPGVRQRRRALAPHMHDRGMDSTDFQDLYRANPQLVRYRLLTTDSGWRDAWYAHGYSRPVPGAILDRDFSTVARHMQMETAFEDAEKTRQEPIPPGRQKVLEEKVGAFSRNEIALNHAFFGLIGDPARLDEMIGQGGQRLEARFFKERAFGTGPKAWMLEHGMRTPDDLQRLQERQNAKRTDEGSANGTGSPEGKDH